MRWDECSFLIPQPVETQIPKYCIKAPLWQFSWADFEDSVQGPSKLIHFPSFPDVHNLHWLQRSLDNHLSQRCLLSSMLDKLHPIAAPYCSSKSQPECAWWCLALFVLLSGGRHLNLYCSSFLKASSCFLCDGLARNYMHRRDWSPNNTARKIMDLVGRSLLILMLEYFMPGILEEISNVYSEEDNAS